MIKEKINTLLKEYNLLYIIGYDLALNNFLYLGDKNKLDSITLTQTLFDNKEQIESLNNCLENQILPQAWKQGRVKCLISKPKENYILGVFYHDDISVQESVVFGKNIHNILIEIFKNEDAE